VSKPIWIRLRSVLERDADATSVELSRESAEEMLAEIKRLTVENERLRAYALKSFTVVEFCCGEGFLLPYPYYDCDDLLMEGVDLLKVEHSEEARAALSGDKQ
jgi:hypothetical protein